MDKKSSELEDNQGILSNTDKSIISTTATNSADDAFIEKYTNENTADDTAQEDEISDEPEQIRQQIEETRKEMGETIDAIQEKLSFQNISEQVSEQVNNVIETAKESVYEATIGKVGNFMRNVSNEIRTVGRDFSKTEVYKTAKTNPVPFALIGLGAGLLLLDAFGRKKSYGYQRSYDYDYDSQRYGRNKPSMLNSAGEKVSDAANATYENVSSAAQKAYGGVTNVASSAYQTVDESAQRVYEKAGEFGTQAVETYEYYIEENPLAVGAVALAIGAAVGFSLPSTRYEGELMGEARQNLLQKAQDTAGTLVDKAKEVATEASRTIQDEVKAQGSAR
jgi:ElaB/YqjD/DUF883 family membrane-anchored ribosome-binding protein/uncharacterized protein YdhG (YjbR/CyaY superfamily)